MYETCLVENCSANKILYEEALKVMHELGVFPKSKEEVKSVFEEYRRVLKYIMENKSIPCDTPDAETLSQMREFFSKLHKQLRTVIDLTPVLEDIS